MNTLKLLFFALAVYSCTYNQESVSQNLITTCDNRLFLQKSSNGKTIKVELENSSNETISTIRTQFNLCAEPKYSTTTFEFVTDSTSIFLPASVIDTCPSNKRSISISGPVVLLNSNGELFFNEMNIQIKDLPSVLKSDIQKSEPYWRNSYDLHLLWDSTDVSQVSLILKVFENEFFRYADSLSHHIYFKNLCDLEKNEIETFSQNFKMRLVLRRAIAFKNNGANSD